MKRLFKKPYLYWIVSIFLIYFILNLWISGFYEKIPLYIKYKDTVNWLRLIISVLFALSIGVLVSLNAVLSYIKYKERQNCKSQAAITGIGTVGGIITGFCPLCVTGLIPLLFSALGITFTFSSLPFFGLEVQAFIIILLIISLYSLNKKRKRNLK